MEITKEELDQEVDRVCAASGVSADNRQAVSRLLFGSRRMCMSFEAWSNSYRLLGEAGDDELQAWFDSGLTPMAAYCSAAGEDAADPVPIIKAKLG